MYQGPWGAVGVKAKNKKIHCGTSHTVLMAEEGWLREGVTHTSGAIRDHE